MSYPTAKEAREAGWFSRRHRSRDAHEGSVATRNASRGPWARRRKAEERQVILSTLTAEQRREKFAKEKQRYDSGH